MKKKYSLHKITVLVVLLFTLSCKKTEIPAGYADYVGIWVSDFSQLEIEPSGIGSYDNTTELMPVNGRVKIEPNQITISSALLRKKLRVDKAPYKEDMGLEVGIVTGVLIDKMDINNEVFTKLN